MILFLAEPFGVNPDGDLDAAPIQKKGGAGGVPPPHNTPANAT